MYIEIELQLSLFPRNIVHQVHFYGYYGYFGYFGYYGYYSSYGYYGNFCYQSFYALKQKLKNWKIFKTN
jgi:hypothetical protein